MEGVTQKRHWEFYPKTVHFLGGYLGPGFHLEPSQTSFENIFNIFNVLLTKGNTLSSEGSMNCIQQNIKKKKDSYWNPKKKLHIFRRKLFWVDLQFILVLMALPQPLPVSVKNDLRYTLIYESIGWILKVLGQRSR